MKKLAILLSTYNGEKYIEEQILSLEKQTYKNINIIIRDDNSHDNTVKIIKKLQKKYKNIELITGNNLGFRQSFFYILKHCGKYDYYAFCDQDDVWLKGKIKFAIELLDKEKSINDIPILYASNYDYYNGEMKFINHSNADKKSPSFAKSLIECIAPGMTMVINNKAKEELIKNMPNDCMFHDWWLYMLCSAMGKVIYDPRVTVKYRRHSDNVTTVEKGIIKKTLWRIKTFIFSDHWSNVKKQLLMFKSIYDKQLNKKNKEILNLFSKQKNIFTQIQKFFYPVRFKDTITAELMIRFMFIIGKI